jgi:hypothetical protein
VTRFVERRLDRAPRWVISVLDSSFLWHAIAYIGISVISVLLWVNYTRVAHTQTRVAVAAAAQARADSARLAEAAGARARTRANAEASYQRCRQSIPVLRKFSDFVEGEKEANRIVVLNSEDILNLTPRDDPLRKVRESNLARLRVASARVQNAPAIPIPTIKACGEARDKILVDGGLKARHP